MNHDEFDDDGGGGDNSVPNDTVIEMLIICWFIYPEW